MAPWPCFNSTPFLDLYLWNGSCVEGCRMSEKKQENKLNIDSELSFLALVAMCKQWHWLPRARDQYALQKW